MKFKILSIFFFICLPVFLVAQTRSTETVKINGQKYYVHTIKDGESLEGIARIYNVDVVDVAENNPTVLATGALKTGMRLRIPDLAEITQSYPLSQWNFVYHQVKTQKKLKDIAKEYNIDVKDIKKNNPDISNKPAVLSKIRIPLKRGSKEALAYANKTKQHNNNAGNNSSNGKDDDTTNPALSFNWDDNNTNPEKPKNENGSPKKEENQNKSCDVQNYNPRQQSYNISYLLPLRLIEPSKKDYSYVAFLEGALLAVEQMKFEGFSAKISIKDAYDKASLEKVLAEKEMEKSDLIIGPFSQSSLKTVSEFSKKNDIPIVSPYESRTEVLAKDNPYFLQIYPSDAHMNRELFQKTVNNGLINVVLIHPTSPDSAMLKTYQEGIKSAFTNFTTYTHKMGLRPESGREALSAVLKKDMPNLVFIASNEEAFVSDLLDRLMLLNANRANKIIYPITIYGTMQWRKDFKMLNITNYYALNMHIVQAFYVDYSDEDVKNFIRNYRQTYNNEPSQYAFQGYDVTSYFLSALKKYGTGFTNCIHDFDIKLLQSRYKFERLYGNDGGNVNTESFLLEYTPEMDIVKH